MGNSFLSAHIFFAYALHTFSNLFITGGKMRYRYLFILFLAMFAAALPAALHAEEGVTDTEIHVANFGPLSGPAKLWGDTLYGAELVFKKVNAEGGIHGRKIVYHMIDDSYNPAKAKAGVKRMQESVGIFAWVGGAGTATSMAVKEYLVNRNVPWVGPVSGAKSWVHPPERTIFTLTPHYEVSAKVLCKYAVQKMGKKRIAIVYLNDGYGQSGLEGAQEGLKELNMQAVAVIPVDRSATDVNKVALELRKANPDTIIVWLDPFKTLRLISITKKMNLTPQWMSSMVLGEFPQMYQLSKGLVKGMITDNYANYEAPGLMAGYKAAFEKYANKKAHWSLPFTGGMGHAEIMVEGLKRAGRDLTREKFIKALESLDDFKGIAPGVTFKPFSPNDPDCRYGVKKIYLQQCMAGGETKRITEWITE